jgi:hypothetical protein
LSALSNILEKNTPGNWRKLSYTRRKYNKQPDAEQPQPIPTILNCFSLPDILQEESEAFHYTGLVEKTATVKE